MKRYIAVALAAATSTGFAGAMGELCTNTNAAAPCEARGWGVGAQALYLQPSLGKGNVRGLEGTVNTANSNSRFVNFNPKYLWGFEIDGQYDFDTGNDLSVSWYHIDGKSPTQFMSSLTAISSETITNSTFFSSQTWNAVNLEFGQRFNIGDHKFIRLHGGATYADIHSNWSTTSFVTSLNTMGMRTHNRSFNGGGPRLGADLQYGWNQFHIYSKAAIAALVGTQKLVRDSTTRGHISGSMVTVVPELETKLGVNYTYLFAKGSDLTFDIGWMWNSYIDAIYAERVSTTTGAPDVDFFNFGLQGLFFGLTWRT